LFELKSFYISPYLHDAQSVLLFSKLAKGGMQPITSRVTITVNGKNNGIGELPCAR